MMKVFKALIFYFLSILLLSCIQNKGKFTIINESGFDIDSLFIMPDSKKQYAKIKKGKNIEYYIAMNEVKTDGSYFISFKNSETDEIVSQRFGYYTNGYQIEDVINIRVLNDTILIKNKYN